MYYGFCKEVENSWCQLLKGFASRRRNIVHLKCEDVEDWSRGTKSLSYTAENTWGRGALAILDLREVSR